MTCVILTMHEMMQGALVGAMRRCASIRDQRNKNLHARMSDWNTEIDGALAEQAVAKWRGHYWCGGVNTFKDDDVPGLQVRSTRIPTGHLIVRENDDPDATFVLVITDPPRFDIVGCAVGHYARDVSFWRPASNGEAGAWWVPQDALCAVEQLGLPIPSGRR